MNHMRPTHIFETVDEDGDVLAIGSPSTAPELVFVYAEGTPYLTRPDLEAMHKAIGDYLKRTAK